MARQRGRSWIALSLVVVVAPALAKERPIELRGADARISGKLNVVAMNRVGTAALSGSPAKLGGFLPAFDRRLDTEYEPREAGVAQVQITFSRPQSLSSVRLLPAIGEYEWQLESAESQPDLEGRAGSYRVLVPAQRRVGGTWAESRWPEAVSVRLLRLTLTPISGGDRVRLRELNLEAEQSLESISVQTKSSGLPIGERVPLEVTGYFSGGETRLLKSKEFAWQVTPAPAARIEGGNIIGRRRGPVEVRVSWGKLSSIPLPLEVFEAD